MITTKSQKNPHTLNTTNKNSKIILLDGRLIELSIGGTYKISDIDGNNQLLRLETLEPGNSLHESIYTCIKTTLATHSISYVVSILYGIKSWLELPQMHSKSCIDINDISLLNKIPVSYRAFVIPLLRKIAAVKLPGLSEEVIDFLRHPHKWEERSRGEYYALITNDPEKGALTEQEIHNIHSQLHLAYSTSEISLADYTICWFFIGTGVRPSQAHRIKKKRCYCT